MTATVIEEEVTTTVVTPPLAPTARAVKVKKVKKVKKVRGLKRITKPIKRAAKNVNATVTKGGKKAKKTAKKAAKKSANAVKVVANTVVVASKRVGRSVASRVRTGAAYAKRGAIAARAYVVTGSRIAWDYMKYGGNWVLRGIGYAGNLIATAAAFVGNIVGAGIATIGALIGTAVISVGMFLSAFSTYIVWGIIAGFFIWLAGRSPRGSLKKKVKTRVKREKTVTYVKHGKVHVEVPDENDATGHDDLSDVDYPSLAAEDITEAWLTVQATGVAVGDHDWAQYPQDENLRMSFQTLSNIDGPNRGFFIGRHQALADYLMDPAGWNPSDKRPLSLLLHQLKTQQSTMPAKDIRAGYNAQVALLQSLASV